MNIKLLYFFYKVKLNSWLIFYYSIVAIKIIYTKMCVWFLVRLCSS